MGSLEKYNFKDDHGHPLGNCQDYLDMLKRATRAESDLVAMRQRAEEAEKELKDTLSRHVNLFNSLKASWDKKGSRVLSAECEVIKQRKRAERAEEALRAFGIICPIDKELCIPAVCLAAGICNKRPVPKCQIADASKMGGEQADMTIQWSEPGTPVIDCTTGVTFFVPRERRLEELVRDAFMQGWDAKDSDYPHGALSYSERAEEAWERSTARAALSPEPWGGQDGG